MKKEKYEFTIKELDMSDFDAVLHFINTHFVPFETLCKGTNSTAKDLEEFHTTCIKHVLEKGINLAVYENSSNEMAGLILSQNLIRNVPSSFNVQQNLNDKEKKVSNIICGIESDYDVFADTKLNKLLYITFLSVDKKFSGYGLSYMLITRCEEMSIKEGCQACNTQCTAGATQHIFPKLGYNVVKEVQFNNPDFKPGSCLDFDKMSGIYSAKIVLKYF